MQYKSSMGSKKGRKATSAAWKPGQSGNPAGKPLETYGEIYRRLGAGHAIRIVISDPSQPDKPPTVIERVAGDKGHPGTLKEALCAVTMAKALSGNLQALEHIVNREEGAPKQVIEQTTVSPMLQAFLDIAGSDKDAE